MYVAPRPPIRKATCWNTGALRVCVCVSLRLRTSVFLQQTQLSHVSRLPVEVFLKRPHHPSSSTFLKIQFNLVPLDPCAATLLTADLHGQVHCSTVCLYPCSSDPLFTARCVFSFDPGSCCQHKVTQAVYHLGGLNRREGLRESVLWFMRLSHYQSACHLLLFPSPTSGRQLTVGAVTNLLKCV